MKKLSLLLIGVMINLISLNATTLTVDDDTGINNGVSPFATITAAITAASSGDIINITGGADNIHTEAGIFINKDITIQGQGQTTTFVQAAAIPKTAEDGIFTINAGYTVVFQNLTLRNGDAKTTGNSSIDEGGAVYINCNSSTDITFDAVSISNNYAQGDGGAIYITGSGGIVNFTNCVIDNNEAEVTNVTRGGGIQNYGATNLSIMKCTFNDNSSGFIGGGVAHNVTASNVYIYNSTFYNNVTGGGHASIAYGGGLHLSTANNCEVINCTIVNNSTTGATTQRGSGVYTATNGTVSFTNTIIANNSGANENLYASNGPKNFTTNLIENCNGSKCSTFAYTNATNIATTPTSCGVHAYFSVAGSDAEDNGTSPSGNIPTDDICGTIRSGLTYDIGAYDDNTISQAALSFPGNSGDYAQLDGVSADFQFTTNFTIELWVQLDDLTNLTYLIDNSNRYALIYRFNSANDVEFFANFYTGDNPRTGSQITIPDNNWHHVAYTYDGATFAGYLDGSQVFSLSKTFSLSPYNTLFLGAASNGLHLHDGQMDEIRFWNRALTNTEIGLAYQNSFTNPTSIMSCLVAYYKMTNASGTVLSDDSGNGNNVNLLGSTTWSSSDANIINGSAISCTVLPVELTYFTAKAQDNNINLLEWQTASEEQNEGFEIERSANGQDWEIIDFVDGNGTTIETQNYTYTDENPLFTTNYYRLKQIDFDGNFEYSKVVIVKNETVKNELIVFPNPVINQLTIENGIGNAIIYNSIGQPVMQLTINNQQLFIDVTDLPSGIYTLQIQHQNGQFSTGQFIK